MSKFRILIAAILLGLVSYANADGISGTMQLTAAMITTALGFTPPSNALTSAHVFVGNGSNVATDTALSQDCTITNAGVVTCLKTNNVAFTSASTTATGTSGATIPLLSTANTWTLAQTFSTPPILTGLANVGTINLMAYNTGTGAVTYSPGTGTGVPVLNTSPSITTPILASIPSSTAALNYLCYNVGTGALTYDSSTTCLLSSLRFKHDVVAIKDPVQKLMGMDAIEFTYNDQSNQKGRQIGLSAESVAKAEPILATYDSEGRPEKVKYMAVIGLLTAALQNQEKRIEALEAHAR